MKSSKSMFWVIVCIIIACVGVAIFGVGDKIKGADKMRFGIDIRGGVEAVFEPQDLERKATESELESARNIIEMRLDAKNITDREVTIDKEGAYIIVKFPWKSGETNFNPEDAIAELGEMAKLTFRDEYGNVMLEGKNVKSAKAMEDTTDMKGSYEVALSFDTEGAKLFECKPRLSKIEQVNLGISQTLARSLNTSFTTGICVLIILVASVVFGISSIKEFALPMFFGLISGCYSSICIAGVLWAMWEERKVKTQNISA